MPTPQVSRFGPGTLFIGEVATEVDVSCQLEYGQIVWEANKDDDIVVLCGDVVAGATTLTAKLSGHIFQDAADPAGIVQASWGALKGQTVPFRFVPNTVDGIEYFGDVVVLPVTVGSGEANANMASDFEWSCVGEPDHRPVTP